LRPSATLRIWLVLPSEDRSTRDAANFLHGTANQRYAVLTPHSSPCHWVTIPFSVDLLTPPHLRASPPRSIDATRTHQCNAVFTSKVLFPPPLLQEQELRSHTSHAWRDLHYSFPKHILLNKRPQFPEHRSPGRHATDMTEEPYQKSRSSFHVWVHRRILTTAPCFKRYSDAPLWAHA
jgi:hypothetical protein